MSGVGSYIKVVDNSGIKKVKCIRIFKIGKQNAIKLGGYFVAAVNKGDKKKKFHNKKICLGLVLLKKKNKLRPAGYTVKAQENRSIVLHSEEQMVGNRFKGPVSIEAKLINNCKAMQYAKVSL